MGIQYKAKLLVGLTYNELESFMDDSDPDDFGFEYASPYYDAPRSEWVVGVRVGSTSDYDFSYVDSDAIQQAREEFMDITGLEGDLILSPHGH